MIRTALRSILRALCNVVLLARGVDHSEVREATRTAEESRLLADLGKPVAGRRNGRKLSQEETAHRAVSTLRTLQNLDGGRLNPSFLTLRALAIALGTRIGSVATG